MNILIAEDTPVFQAAHAFTMKKWGFAYDMAINGIEAVNYAKAHAGEYDLCIMDVSMPMLDGLAATKAIRGEARYLPILGYSADPDMRDVCLESGMDEFIQKPCPTTQLRELIEELTHKPMLAHVNNGTISIAQVKPMNADELKELRELKKNGLTKLKLVGLDRWFIVHKNIQNKISHDLVGEGKEISEFIDRSPDEPGRCHLYKANLYITKDIFMPDELEEAIRKEDEVVLRFDSLAEKRGADK